MKSKKIIAIILAIVLLLQVVSIIPTMATTASGVTVSNIVNNEGLWLTEVYINDYDRRETGRSVDQNYEAIDLFKRSNGATLDPYTGEIMEFIEIASTHSNPITLNEYDISYNNGTTNYQVNIDNAENITIENGQCIVIWNYRKDLGIVDSNGNELSENHFRKALRVPDDVVVLKAVTGTGVAWKNNPSTFTIKKDDNVISTYTAASTATEKDGYSVELKVPDRGSQMEVYRSFCIPTAGSIDATAGHYDGSTTKTFSESQLNGLVFGKDCTKEPSGVYITEIKAIGSTNETSNYLEIYNTTSEAVNLNSDYCVKYCKKETLRERIKVFETSDTTAELTEQNCTVPAGGLAVLVCCNTSGYIVPDGIPADVPVYYFSLNSPDKELGQTDSVGIEIYKVEQTTTDTEATEKLTLVSSFCYTKADAWQSQANGIHLKPNHDRPNMIWRAGTGTTPGSFKESQEQTKYEDDGSKLEVTPTDSVPSSIMQGKELRVLFNTVAKKADGTKGTLMRKRTALYYRLGTKSEDGTITWNDWTEKVEYETTSSQVYIRVPEYYEAIVTADDLYDVDAVQFYVKAYNSYRLTLSDVYQVNVKKLSEVDGIRTNISDGEYVSGNFTLTANAGSDNNQNLEFYIDSENRTPSPMLEDDAYLTFKMSGRIKAGKHALTTADSKNTVIKDLSYWYDITPDGQSVKIDSSYFTYNATTDTYDTTLRFWAGTPGTYFYDLGDDAFLLESDLDATSIENGLYYGAIDFYTVKDLKLRVNDKSYAPLEDITNRKGATVVENVDGGYNIGSEPNTYDTDGTTVVTGSRTSAYALVNFKFSIPAADVPAVGVTLTSDDLEDGEHTLYVCDKTDATNSTTVKFFVDNTLPSINTGITENETKSGNFTIDPIITENNPATSTVVLDNKAITTPYKTSAYALGKGTHTLSVYTTDKAGNQASHTTTFTIDYSDVAIGDADTTNIKSGSATLNVTLGSDASDAEASFYKAEKISEITSEAGSGDDPYLKYTVHVGEIDDADKIVVNWNGSVTTSAGYATRMYVENTAKMNNAGKWDLIATADDNGTIAEASFIAKNHVSDGEATIIVQYLPEKSTAPDLDTKAESTGTEWDGFSKPDSYDFAIAWQTDTQYYAEKFPDIFKGMNQWIVDNADDWKIKYVINTGDLIDDFDMTYQWEIADEAMAIFDKAGMPYGVLAGNHDIAESIGSCNTYQQYFGEDRFKSHPTYGESYKNNLCHYDIINQDGEELLILYASWNLYRDEINWMNEVLTEHSDKKAILCFHSYSYPRSTSDTRLDYFGKLIEQNVVAKHSNVFAVLNGHFYGSSYYVTTYEDTNTDGTTSTRNVYHICKDYQADSRGGDGYIDMLYFDLDSDKIYINSYWTMAPESIQYTKDAFNFFDAANAKTAIANSTKLTGDALTAQLENTGKVKILDNTTPNGEWGEYYNAFELAIDLNSADATQTIQATIFEAYVCHSESLGTAKFDPNTGTASYTATGFDSSTTQYWFAEVTDNNSSGKAITEFVEFITPKRLWGDANNDTIISIRDVTTIQLHLVGLYNMTQNACIKSDVNGDGNMDIKDATCIQLLCAKLIDKFPSEG